MKVIRVFPRRTKATPDDQDVYIGYPDLFAQADKVLISVAFTWDISEAERLAEAWKDIAPVEIGGPAFNVPGDEFEPGKFLKLGYVITSRGCPNRCWFCAVPKREGYRLRELQIKNGWNVLDDNLLACSEKHIRDVFAMLKRQPERALFTGGLEAARLKPWHVDLLVDLKPKQIYFAYDTPDDYEPLRDASKLLHDAGISISSHTIGAYCLIGYPKDSFDRAEERLTDLLKIGVMPYAMLWRGQDGKYAQDWRKFQRQWVRPQIIFGKEITHDSHTR